MWGKLKALYIKKTVENQLYLKQTLFTLQMGEGTSIISHMNMFDSLLIDLSNSSMKIDNENQAILFLFSLP
jgi:hypothetical protein